MRKYKFKLNTNEECWSWHDSYIVDVHSGKKTELNSDMSYSICGGEYDEVFKDFFKLSLPEQRDTVDRYRKPKLDGQTPTIPDAVIAGVMANVLHETRAEKEPAMNYAHACVNVPAPMGDQRTGAQQAKDYLILSLNQEVETKLAQASKSFGLQGDYPRTLADIQKYLDKGWVKIHEHLVEDYGEDYVPFSMYDAIIWKNPDFKVDKKGFNEAEKSIRKEASDVKDQIVVFGAEKGLEALNAFKAKTFH